MSTLTSIDLVANESSNMNYLHLRLLRLFAVMQPLLANLNGGVQAVPIVGGQLVTRVDNTNKYPYMVSIQDILDNGARLQHFCGGSLIGARWILTAAHCVWRKRISNIVALIGYDNIAEAEHLKRYEIQRAHYIYFQPVNYQNDISLLELRYAYSSELPPSQQFASLPLPGMKANRQKPCKIIGYGATKHAGQTQQHLNEAEVHVISNRHCRRILGHVWAPQNGENTVCALGDNQDSCQGDSGGPLICKHADKDYIYGLVSHGLTCGVPGLPSIYTVTIPYIDWMQLLMQRFS